MRATMTAALLLFLASQVAIQVSDSGQTAPAQATPSLEDGFQRTVKPFVTTYCTECHGGAKPKGDIDLSTYTSADSVAKDLRRWETVLEQLDSESMPPEKAKQHPSGDLRRQVVTWIRDVRKHEAKRNAGDPGPVAARRLSNAEYDYTIRDLTGVDIRPAKEFPVDPANEAGFDNSAESLTMSPSLLNKYMEGARKVSEYLFFKPEGLAFAPYPVVADTDRDKYCVRQIIDFYKKHHTDYADYFQAAWRYEHRKELGQPNATLAALAADWGISAKYLATISSLLTGPAEDTGPIAALQAMFKELPPPALDADKGDASEGSRAGSEKMRDFVLKIREKVVPDVKNLRAPGMDAGTQPLVYWKDRTMAANRTKYAGGAPNMQLEKFAPNAAAARAIKTPEDPAALERYEAAFVRFCEKFPDTFVVTERARVYLDAKGESKLVGRYLSAGLHSQTGYFRDDGPLYGLILSEAEQKELDRLWLEFEVVTGAVYRQYTSLMWFERSDSSFMRSEDFNPFRPEDKDVTSEAKMAKMAEVWLAKARRTNASAVALQAFKDHFEITSAQIRLVEKTRQAAEPKHLESLQIFAERAYRRPLSRAEREAVGAFYHILRDKDGLSHEDAVRDTLVSILMSPHFLYRVEPSLFGAVPGVGPASRAEPETPESRTFVSSQNPSAAKDEKSTVQPLSDYALASRLSYFLWATMPDAELMARAADGTLHQPEVLVAQVRRMVKDARIRGLATEFAANWLDIRRFEEHNAVDRERFKEFTDELRVSMFEEPLHFFVDVARADRPVLDFVNADYTFVNPFLAKHYGMPGPKSLIKKQRIDKMSPPPEPESNPDLNNWVKVEEAGKYGRGGLLPMAVFLTKNSPGLRTSPVKRGYWVVRRILGEKIPAPPPDVPVIPTDEAKLDLPLRDVLAQHRADKSCAACHARFDAFGLVFEGYGPVGEVRKLDLGGRPVETQATFPGGGEGNGLEGLRAYLKNRRQDDFLDNLCAKLLAYALGRTLIPSDDLLIDEMRQKLATNGYRFSALTETIVMSPQFLNRRS